MSTIQELEDAFDRVRGDGYYCFISIFGGGDVDVSIGKNTYGKTEVGVKGRGKTVKEAFDAAFANFPKDPLDGSKWIKPPQTPAIGTTVDDIKDTL